jgi:phosphoribosyl 1,2-cyclic phosphodiesterase
MRVRFYGVRGSTPTPGPSTVRYGGNTVCVDVRLGDGSVVLLDAGTGLRALGKTLMSEQPKGPLSLLLTHVHWDHILGLPFFAPIWQKGTHLRVFPLANAEQETFCQKLTLFDGIHFPVHASDIPAKIELVAKEEATWAIGPARVRRIALNHPGGAQGFRIDDGKTSIAYLTDNELGQAAPTTTLDELAAFARGVDLLIHDAQYVESDMPDKRGWGHSVLPDVLRLGQRAEAKHLVLFHHEPERDDDALDAIGVRASAWMREHAPDTRVTVAHEGLALSLA